MPVQNRIPPLKSVGVLLRDVAQPFPLDRLRAAFDRIGARMHLLDHVPPPERLDLIIAMGGDGTVLRALDEYPGHPVLAINYGTVGFLTAGDRSELEKILDQVLSGDYVLSERLILRCEYGGQTAHAVNEVLIRSTLRMIQVEVFVNEAPIRTIRGDGVIVGTPTGSTGYLLSTGAPLVMPDVHCFVLDGINEYNFSSRALILAPESSIRLRLPKLEPGQEAHLIVDGKFLGSLKERADVRLSRSERRAQLVFLDRNYFFHNLASRLRWQ
jgi:NAD+ kinase